MIEIRPFEQKDWTATWHITRPVFRAGETYPFSPDITVEARQIWIEIPSAAFVAVDGNNELLILAFASSLVQSNRHPVPEWVHQQVYLNPYPRSLCCRITSKAADGGSIPQVPAVGDDCS